MEQEPMTGASRPDYGAEIAQVIRGERSAEEQRALLSEYHENDIAATLSVLSPDERSRLYGILDVNTLADVLDYAEQTSEYLNELSLSHRPAVLAQMEITVAAAYLKELEEEERERLLSLLPREPKREIALLASFGEDEIGSRMTTDYIWVRRGTDIRGTMQQLIEQAAYTQNVSTVYVVDEERVFVGAIDLKDLIRARSGDRPDSIVMTSYPYVYAHEPIDDCLERIKGYSEDSIPVLDEENKLCGILTAQELAELIEDEIGDDYAKLGGLSAEEDLREPLPKSIGKRLPWLLILFVLGLSVSWAVSLFDSLVSRLSLIVSFQSLILGMAGNVGTQSLAVTVRALTDGSLGKGRRLALILKEARVGLCNGLILGLFSFLLIGAYLFLLRGETASLAFSVSLCTGLSLAAAMLLSGLSGTVIPLLLARLRIDPAVASGPFITTVNDLVAVLTYYGLAWLLLLPLV